MLDVIGIIDRIFAEHKLLISDTSKLVNITNDAGALIAINRSNEAFMPGRTDQVQGLAKFEELRKKIQDGLNAHFNLEETLVLEAIVEHGNLTFIGPFKTLLSEHNLFRNQMDSIKSLSNELIAGQLSRAIWETQAYDMRIQTTNLQKQLEIHATNERILLVKLKEDLKKTPK
jgi:hypothetical protein